MKKTLFLGAILGTALCSPLFAADYTVTQNSGEIKYDGKQMSTSLAGDNITLNVTQSGNGAYFQDVPGGQSVTIAANLIINSLVFNNGYSRNPNLTYKFTGDISGTGAFTRGANQNGNNFCFTGDVSGYTGDITFSTKNTSDNPNNLIFDASAREGGMTVNAASITMQNTAILAMVGDVTLNSNITSKTTNIGAGTTTIGSGATAALDTLSYAEGAAVKVAGGATVNFTTANTVVESTVTEGNGFNSYHYTRNADSAMTFESGSAVQLKGVDATIDAGVITSSSIKNYVVNETSGTLTADILAEATQIQVQQADTALTVEGGSLAYSDVVFATGAGLSSLAINDGGSVSVVGDNNNIGFATGTVTINAGSTLQLQGHDALGYNNGDGKGSATPLIEMQGADGNKAVLDNQDTSGGNPANLTFTTDLTLKGHTEVKGNNIKVFGMVLTATGTDNTVSNNLVLDKAFTVDVTGADDTLVLNGNISGNNALTKTGEGSLTMSGTIGSTINNTGAGTLTVSGTIGSTINNTGAGTLTVSGTINNGVQLNNTGSGTTVLDSVTLNGRLNLLNTTGTTFTGGATATGTDSYAVVVANGTADANVTMADGTYDLGTKNVGVGVRGTLTVAEGATLTANQIQNSSTLSSNGTLNVEGTVTANGGSKVSTLNNAGTATFNDAFEASTVNLQDGSSTTFGGTTTITTLSATGDATITTADIAVSALTMKAGATLSIGQQQEESLVSVQTLTVEGAATLNADLELAAASTLHMDGTLTMGSTIELGEGITLEGNLLASLLDGSTDSITLFTSVDALTLGGVDYSHPVYGYEVFSNPELGNTPDKKYVVSYNGSDVKLTVVPEPATATLSLLALAALAARRRRH